MVLRPGRTVVAADRFWPAIAGLALVVGVALLQMAALTPRPWQHPLWLQAGAVLGGQIGGRISVNPHETGTALMRLLSYAGVFWLALQLGAQPHGARRIVQAIALAGLAYAAYGLLVFLLDLNLVLWWRKWTWINGVTSSFVNRNSYATYAGLGLICIGRPADHDRVPRLAQPALSAPALAGPAGADHLARLVAGRRRGLPGVRPAPDGLPGGRRELGRRPCRSGRELRPHPADAPARRAGHGRLGPDARGRRAGARRRRSGRSLRAEGRRGQPALRDLPADRAGGRGCALARHRLRYFSRGLPQLPERGLERVLEPRPQHLSRERARARRPGRGGARRRARLARLPVRAQPPAPACNRALSMPRGRGDRPGRPPCAARLQPRDARRRGDLCGDHGRRLQPRAALERP